LNYQEEEEEEEAEEERELVGRISAERVWYRETIFRLVLFPTSYH
jgi:predicted methyltransferase